jgi:hypothetical protein
VRAAQTLPVYDFFRLSYHTLHRNIFNRQTRQLGGHVLDLEIDLRRAFEVAKQTLREAAWVGFTEMLPGDLPGGLTALGRQLPELARLELPRLNVSAGQRSLADIDPATVAKICELNRYDLDLYQFATEEFGPEIRGRLRQWKEGLARRYRIFDRAFAAPMGARHRDRNEIDTN